jgi:DNA-directed RNA polymerase specialized sigma subunit
MNATTDKDDMTPAMAFLVDKLKSGKAELGDIGIILADTYRQTDHQSKVLDEQTKSIKLLQDKVTELEPTVNTLMKERNAAKWAIRGVVSFASVFGIGLAGWIYTQGQSIAYALSLDEQKINQLASFHAKEIKQELEEKIRTADEKDREWVDSRYQRKP